MASVSNKMSCLLTATKKAGTKMLSLDIETCTLYSLANSMMCAMTLHINTDIGMKTPKYPSINTPLDRSFYDKKKKKTATTTKKTKNVAFMIELHT